MNLAGKTANDIAKERGHQTLLDYFNSEKREQLGELVIFKEGGGADEVCREAENARP